MKNIIWKNLRYVALGDSITFALDGTRDCEQILKPYCELVKDELGLQSATNYGINGSTIASYNRLGDAYMPMCERYALMEDADIVSVMGGTNDFGRLCMLGHPEDTDTNTFFGALNILCKGLKDKYPNAFIFFMTPLKLQLFGDSAAESKLNDFCNAVKLTCASFDIPVLDTAKEANFAIEYDSPGYYGDGLHPSAQFHREVLAPLIVRFIRDRYPNQ